MEQKEVDRLLLSVADGNMQALEALYHAMYREIYCYILSMVGNVHTAEDLTQDTFLRVYRYAAKFTSQGMGKSWIYKIAGRVALTYLQKERVPSQDITFVALSADENSEEQAITSHMLAQAMNRLSDSERQLVTMHAVSGMTLAEIAHALNVPLGTVKWKHASAIKKLKKLLGENLS